MELCWKGLIYRDKLASDKIQMAKVSMEGIQIAEPYVLQTDWFQPSYKIIQDFIDW